MKKTLFIDVVAGLFLLVFLYAALTKMLDYQNFLVQLSKSPVLTSNARFYSIATPLIEILIAAMLVVDKARIYALYASFSLMVMFTTYIVIILNFSPYIPCSCGGILQSMNWTQHLMFNIFLVLLVMVAILLTPGRSATTATEKN